jgi:transposase
VEATGRLSRRLVEALAALQTAWPTASIVNPKRPRDFAKSLGVREKTDPIDARILAAYAAVNRPATSPAMPEGYRRLRELSRARQTLVRQRTALGNCLRDQDEPIVRELLERAAESLDQAIDQSEKQAQRLIREDDGLHRDYRLLQSIKGIGPVVAWTLLAELGDLRAYRRNQLVARVGVYPGRWESGKSVQRKPRWVKGGCAPVRKALFNAARAILNSKNNTLRAYADRLATDGRKPMACIAALMRKLLLVARAILIQEVPYDPNHS